MDRPIPMRVTALAVAAIYLTGCFEYVPATLEAVPDGQDVRLFVTQEGLTEASTVMENTDQPIVQGKLVSRDGDRLFIRIPTVVRQEGFNSSILGQDVAVPVREVVQVQRRQVNRLETGLLVAGTAGLAAAVVFVIMDSGGGNPKGPTDGAEEMRVPLFSIPLP